MRIPQNKEQRLKAGLHMIQALFIFITACLTLSIYTTEGSTGGEIGFCFTMCFLSVPALIYQVMVPMWTRAWRFASVYAYAIIDILFTVLWFSASVAVGYWNSRSTFFSKDKDSNIRACTGGSATRCGVSKAVDGFSLMIAFLFCFTAMLAYRSVRNFQQTGLLPQSTVVPPKAPDGMDARSDPWSSRTEEVDLGSNEHNKHGDNNDVGLQSLYNEEHGNTEEGPKQSLLSNTK